MALIIGTNSAFDFVSCLCKATLYIHKTYILPVSLSHHVMFRLLMHELFILVFMPQQNDGCLIIPQMNFASQWHGRCYLLPEQLSKDQSSTSNKSKCSVLSGFSRAHPLSPSRRL